MDALISSLQTTNMQTDVYGFTLSMAVSFLASLVVALLYFNFFENRRRGAQVHRFFLIGGPSITAMLLAIQFSLPLSLGLLGSLSIIRFRTPVKEPEEVGYIMLLIALSISCATFNFLMTGVLIVFAIIALIVQRYAPLDFIQSKKNGLLLLSFTDKDHSNKTSSLSETLSSIVPGGKFESVSESEGLTSYHYSFDEGHGLDVEKMLDAIREKAKPTKVNIFFSN